MALVPFFGNRKPKLESEAADLRDVLDEFSIEVMRHFPARIIADQTTFGDWIARYQGEVGVKQALLLAGSPPTPAGDFDSSIQLLETGSFDKHGFEHLHIAGHPEGNRDIDADGETRQVDEALMWKQSFRNRSDAQMAIVTHS